MSDIIADLKKLNAINQLSIDDMDKWAVTTTNADIIFYLKIMQLSVKPENATSDLLKRIMYVLMDERLYSEVKVSGGFVDFALHEAGKNPVLIELKPLFVQAKDTDSVVMGIRYNPLKYQDYEEQIVKYLKENDYLVLTNLRESYFFNRDVLNEEFKPFHAMSFTDLLEEYMTTRSFWDILRRFDADVIKPTLENQFFEDLVKWYGYLLEVQFIEKQGFSKEELAVLFLNKVIFIKTLEDYCLIPFNFLSDSYFRQVNMWKVKEYLAVFDRFFKEIEEWFWIFYDTELFKVKIWDFIDKDEVNIELFKTNFEKVLGFGEWEKTFGKGMVHYDYRKIDEDVFGKAYETFIAKQRKDSGIYYTHRVITEYMAERLVDELFAHKINVVLQALDDNRTDDAISAMHVMQQVKIADTCSGSGSFLIKVFRKIYQQYQRIDNKTAYVKQLRGRDLFDKPRHVTEIEKFRRIFYFEDERRLLANIVLHHIFAIDIDDRALETAKTNIWKEIVKVKPAVFNFLALRRVNHVLPNLRLNMVCADSLYDLPIKQQVSFIFEHHRADIVRLHRIRQSYLADVNNPLLLNDVEQIKFVIRESLLKNAEGELFRSLLGFRTPTFIALEFFYLYFDETGQPLSEENQGFDGIISNPPWEILKPIQKEFAEVGKYGVNVLDFTQWFKDKLKNEADFKENWIKYASFYKFYGDFVKNTYQYQGIGDLNYYKLFMERDIQLLRKQGFLNILVPSGIQTDKGSSELRHLLIHENTLSALYSFENRGYMETEKAKHKIKIFPDVHPQFKFTIVSMQKKASELKYDFKGLFYLHNPKDLYEKSPIIINAQMIAQFSPESASIMEFRTHKDYKLCLKIRGIHGLLGETELKLRREFDMTLDNRLFSKVKEENDLPLFEGKMIHQYHSDYAQPKYFIKETTGREVLLNKEVNRINKIAEIDFKESDFVNHQFYLDYQTYRLIYRAVGGSTNERTLISAVIPRYNFLPHSVNYLVNCYYEKQGDSVIQNILSSQEIIFMMALFNSLILNYYIRNKISANLTMNFIHELPIPEVEETLKKQIVEKAFTLLYIKSQSALYEELREELQISPIDKEKIHIERLRAELEVIIAKQLYKIDAAEWQYLTSTFTYGGNSPTKKELDQIIEISREIY